MEHKYKTCLVVSYGPVPTPQYQTIEGGGMRAWGLAKGLKEQGIDVTVAINASFPQNVRNHDGIKLVNWSPDEDFRRLINSFDSVITSYCMGSDSVFIADNIGDHVQLILDAYVPIYVEVSARDAKDIDDEFIHYMGDVARYNHVLKRGDYFLCASDSQKIYYTGVLSSLGIINPRSYRQERLIVAPFGIHDEPAKAKTNPYKKLGIKDEDFLVLWFGGLYPWFKIDEFLESVNELSSNPKIKFAIVGGKNPFNPNPAFTEQYERALEFAKQNHIKDKNLFFIDWVDFDKRIDWYKRANVVISINNPGEENNLAWRTRVMDYVWAELPTITNGGDPLSEQLLLKDAAIRLDNLSRSTISNTIVSLANSPAQLKKLKTSVKAIRSLYFWPHIVEPIVKVINESTSPFIEEYEYRKKLGVSELESENLSSAQGSSINFKNPIDLTRRTLIYARRKGLKRSAYLGYTIARTQFNRRKARNPEKKYIFLSHPIDNSGAPKVLIEMVEEYADKFGGRNIRVFAPGILPHQLKRLKSKAIVVEKAALALTDKMIDLQMGVNDGDFILLNTLAIYPNYRDFVLRALASGRIKNAYWFIHEDTAQIPFVSRDLTEEKFVKPIAKQVNNGKLKLLVPSKKIKEEYEKLWEVNNVEVIPLRVDVPERYKAIRSAGDYSKIDFLLSGSAGDARKGQLLAISALLYFKDNFYDKYPSKYRNYKLHLVSVGDGYVPEQVKIIGKAFLANHLVIHPSLPYDEALKVTADCNAVICCSLNETFGIYVAEGMFMGHVVLRNNSAGMEEQLHNGKNGYFIDHTDIRQFASSIEKILNLNTSDKELVEMGRLSQKIIAPYAKNSYLKILDIK